LVREEPLGTRQPDQNGRPRERGDDGRHVKPHDDAEIGAAGDESELEQAVEEVHHRGERDGMLGGEEERESWQEQRPEAEAREERQPGRREGHQDDDETGHATTLRRTWRTRSTAAQY